MTQYVTYMTQRVTNMTQNATNMIKHGALTVMATACNINNRETTKSIRIVYFHTFISFDLPLCHVITFVSFELSL